MNGHKINNAKDMTNSFSMNGSEYIRHHLCVIMISSLTNCTCKCIHKGHQIDCYST